MLIRYQANINTRSKNCDFALKYAVERREIERVRFLIENGADPLQKDLHKRNLLHISLNHSPNTSNADLKIEKLLIAQGVGMNDKDIRNRTPLHYLFTKIGQSNSTSMIDPIKQVSAYCSQRNVKIDEPDFWGKTPLHYAAQVSATICSLELLNKGCKLEAKDRYGNTPLGIAIISGHVTHAIMMIQKNASVNMSLYKPDPSKFIEEMEKIEEKEFGEEYEKRIKNKKDSRRNEQDDEEI
jgi:ankyrin repeat protein